LMGCWNFLAAKTVKRSIHTPKRVVFVLLSIKPDCAWNVNTKILRKMSATDANNIRLWGDNKSQWFATYQMSKKKTRDNKR
jgi:hypothetical protein